MKYEVWAVERLKGRAKCAVEPSMTCIPLRGDPICMTCFELDVTKESDDVLKKD